MNDWDVMLVNALELETVEIQLLENIDDVLFWVAKGGDASYLLLQKKIGERELRQRIEEFLDRLIVGDFALGSMFPSGLTPDHAKKRYRQLIRIFHPDRGVKSQSWLNYRAEKINKTYQGYVDNEAMGLDFLISDEEAQPEGAVKQGSPKKSAKVRFTYRQNVWRERLGDPQQFQRRVILTLVACSFLLVLIVYFSNEQQVPSPVLKQFESLELVKKNEDSNGYIVDSAAQKILQEADVLFSDDEALLRIERIEDSIVDTKVQQYIEEVNALFVENELFKVEGIEEARISGIEGSNGLDSEAQDFFFADDSDLDSSLLTINKDEEIKVVVKDIQRLEVSSNEPLKESTFKVPAINSLQADFTHYVEKLKRYYELGDSHGVASLYISSGRENEIRGSDKILKYYKKAFTKTYNRKFDYVIDSSKQDDQATMVIQGRMYLSFLSKKIFKKGSVKLDAAFTILFVKVGDEFKIASFNWKEIE